jgi:hypothetical protein
MKLTKTTDRVVHRSGVCQRHCARSVRRPALHGFRVNAKQGPKNPEEFRKKMVADGRPASR